MISAVRRNASSSGVYDADNLPALTLPAKFDEVNNSRALHDFPTFAHASFDAALRASSTNIPL